LRICGHKTEYIKYEFGERYQEFERMTISGDVMGELENFKNLVLKNGDVGMDLNIGLSAVGWNRKKRRSFYAISKFQ
jgi:hypothetical protein